MSTEGQRDQPRVVVAGWSGTENLGDELLLRALLRLLAERNATATVVSRDPVATAALHGVDAIGLGDAVGLARALRSSAGLVLGPGGILQDETSPFSLPWHLARAGEARVARRPLVGVGLGVGPLGRRGSRAMLRRSLRRHAGIAVRDERSAALLRACGVEDVVAGSDLALTLPTVAVEPADRIVVCLRPHRPGGHVVPLRHLPPTELAPERIAAVAAGLDDLAGAIGLPLHLVALERGRDDRYHELVAERLRSPVTTATPDLDDVVAEVAASRLVVAMRFHAGVAAVLGARPVALIGYAPKVQSLAESIGGAATLVPDDPTGHRGLRDAGTAVIGRDDDALAARERLRGRAGVHAAVLARILG